MTKILRVEHPYWCAGAEVHYAKGSSTWGKMAPYIRRVIGNMTVKEFMQFLDTTGYKNGWKYRWI